VVLELDEFCLKTKISRRKQKGISQAEFIVT